MFICLNPFQSCCFEHLNGLQISNNFRFLAFGADESLIAVSMWVCYRVWFKHETSRKLIMIRFVNTKKFFVLKTLKHSKEQWTRLNVAWQQGNALVNSSEHLESCHSLNSEELFFSPKKSWQPEFSLTSCPLSKMSLSLLMLLRQIRRFFRRFFRRFCSSIIKRSPPPPIYSLHFRSFPPKRASFLCQCLPPLFYTPRVKHKASFGSWRLLLFQCVWLRFCFIFS